MSIELNVNGYFDMFILDLDGNAVSQKKEAEILKDLQSGELLITMAQRNIVRLPEFDKAIYTFEIDPKDDMEYTFEENEVVQNNRKTEWIEGDDYLVVTFFLPSDRLHTAAASGGSTVDILTP